MRILGIETSCDETAVAIVDDGTRVLSNIIATSKHSFGESGGVIPELAARKQVECMIPVLTKSLLSADTSPKDIDAIAVTKGPGLLGSLLVGGATARTCASIWKKPLVGVHHTLGHLSSTWLEEKSQIPNPKSQTNSKKQNSKTIPLFPLLSLSVSGGHTELWHRTSHTEGTLLGQTRDDAAGEAFDKGASLLGLGYPGGPAIAKAAERGDPNAYEFPLPLHDDNSFDFSFSGLKTALKYLLRDLNNPLVSSRVPSPLCHTEVLRSSLEVRHKGLGVSRDNSDIAASYQHAICLHLLDRLVKAAKHCPDIHEIHIVGGVSANMYLRSLVQRSLPHLPLRFPSSLAYCTDNAAMIAAAGYFLIQERKQKAYEPFETQASMCL